MSDDTHVTDVPDVTAEGPAPDTPHTQADAQDEPSAGPVLSGTFHDLSEEPDDIDVVIAGIDGTAVQRGAGTGPAVTNHGFPGLSRGSRTVQGRGT